MLKPQSLLYPRPEGLYCAPGDFFIDPTRPVDRAVITHGHADHARAGHGTVLATQATLDIMRVRYGKDFTGRAQPLAYGETVQRDGVSVSLAPAGHVLGSAQAVVNWKGMTMVVSGDYKRRRDPTCAAFEPVPCDVFVSEATFGLPVFRHPPDHEEIGKLLKSVAQFPDRTHLVGAYSPRQGPAGDPPDARGGLGPDHLRPWRPGAAERPLSAPRRRSGTARAGHLDHASSDFAGQIVIAPPGAIADRWSRRFADPVSAFASGWMRVRARARQRGVELPLIISDHADWDELTSTVAELNPAELWITHGREEALARWAELRGIAAMPLSLVGYEDEDV